MTVAEAEEDGYFCTPRIWITVEECNEMLTAAAAQKELDITVEIQGQITVITGGTVTQFVGTTTCVRPRTQQPSNAESSVEPH